MKILICNLESLGTPNGVTSVIRMLMRQLPCLEALTSRNSFKTPLKERETNLKAKTLYNEIFWMKHACFTLMNRKIRESDLIHLNPFNFTELILLFLAKIHRKKCIAVMHSNINFHCLTYVIGLEMARLIIVFNLILFMADRIVLLSRAHYENYLKYSVSKKLFERKVLIIPNAIDSNVILDEKKQIERRLSCIFVGRFEERKGIYDLLTVAEQLRDEGIEFLIIGYGHLQNHEKYSNNNVNMIGCVPNEDIFHYYDRCQIFFLPSYSEVFNISILEAMSRGLVLLTSDIPGTREIIKEGRNGYLFPPGDVAKIKDLFLYLKHNPREIEKISRNNLADVKQFSIEKQAKEYLNLYRNVLSHVQNGRSFT